MRVRHPMTISGDRWWCQRIKEIAALPTVYCPRPLASREEGGPPPLIKIVRRCQRRCRALVKEDGCVKASAVRARRDVCRAASRASCPRTRRRDGSQSARWGREGGSLRRYR